ncbi:peptidyl-prolyl cis-trans isomerase [Novosphingobium profundi]|uniref:peptidylprolyl isomerase n=1 Tax=Novosphingobium profundi TaxID=1774954 RepID=UPI001BD9838E|nr:peptidyl-prolyl cis-trans isomerase [Novosphingobium profundi]
MKSLVREPLLHFLVLGGLIFAGWYWLHPPRPPVNEIVIDQNELDHLKMLWKAQWKRDPAPGDVQAIIDRHVREEVFYREGLKLGLDRNDEIVKRRISQKMEAVANDVGALMKPVTDADLAAFLEAHPDQFRLPPAYRFSQVLFVKGEEAKAQATLAALRAGQPIPAADAARLGVPNAWKDAPAPDLANAFGDAFPRELEGLPLGEWAGPIASGYGLHLVRLERRDAPHLPELDEVRAWVEREYEYQAQIDAEQAAFDTLLKDYSVRITAKGVPPATRTALAAK